MNNEKKNNSGLIGGIEGAEKGAKTGVLFALLGIGWAALKGITKASKDAMETTVLEQRLRELENMGPIGRLIHADEIGELKEKLGKK